MFYWLVRWRNLAAVLIVALAFDAQSVFAQEGRRLRAGYASLSGNMAPYWAAKEKQGFSKNRGYIDLVAFPSGTEGMAALTWFRWGSQLSAWW